MNLDTATTQQCQWKNSITPSSEELMRSLMRLSEHETQCLSLALALHLERRLNLLVWVSLNYLPPDEITGITSKATTTSQQWLSGRWE